jgi:predicted CxxxxCH...CXXCH cytochrome family protein
MACLRYVAAVALIACTGTIENAGGPPPPGTPDARVPDASPGAPDANVGVPDAGEFAAICSNCHGDSSTPAPPVNLMGQTQRSDDGVGAHRSHVQGDTTFHRQVLCVDCHVVPAQPNSPGHIDGDNPTGAEVPFGALARTQNAMPEFDDGTNTCSDVYCHGATLNAGGTLTAPVFTAVDGAAKACGACHGVPPPPNHPQISTCGDCHSTMAPGTTTFVQPQKHIDGVVDFR